MSFIERNQVIHSPLTLIKQTIFRPASTGFGGPNKSSLAAMAKRAGIPDTPSETELLQQLASDRLDAFDALYHHYKQPVYANIVKMVKQPEAAEDLLQETFLALWENRRTIHLDRSVGGWLFVVSYNKAISYLKKKLKESTLVEARPTLDETIAQDEPFDEELFGVQLSLIEAAIEHLPARKKEVFRLLRFEGKTHEEVANLLGISVSSVKDYGKQATRFIKDYIRGGVGSSPTAAISALLLFLNS